VFKLKDNHISILESIRGDVKISMTNKDDSYDTKIILHDYQGESLFLTLPKEWIGNEILMKYDWFVPEEKICNNS
jgi:hypothetical protein